MSRQYVLELRTTTWVLWGYGPGRQVVHVDPACSYVDVGVGEPLDFPFELPEHSDDSSLPAPVEYERRTGLAWRFNDGAGNNSAWHLVGTEDEAHAAAQAKVDRMPAYNRVRFANAPVVRSGQAVVS